MTRSAKFMFGSVRLAAVAIVALAGLTSRQAQAQEEICCAGPPPNELTDNAILYLDPNLHVTDANISGNIGIGQGGGFIGSGSGTVAGTVMFAATSGLFSPNGITVTGGATFGNANVQTDVTAVTALSRTLGAEPGTPITITGSPSIIPASGPAISTAAAFGTASGGSVFASAGILDSAGNRVFTANLSEDFVAGTTFTIRGSSSNRVVINIPSTDGLGFDGSIVLEGGITPDHVLFNLDKGYFDTLSGGDPLMIDTDGHPTTGIFLDPNGNFVITDSMIFGRIFGGGSEFNSIIQTLDPTDPTFRTNIVAPPPFATPEPTSLALLGAGLVALGIIRRHRRPVGLSS